jgi:uncharacterized protein YutE (UPF0331/DUF86 family)
MLDPESIAQQLSRMVEQIDDLKKFEQLMLDDYLQDDLRQAAIERMLELLIDSALIINKFLLKRAIGMTPNELFDQLKNHQSFILLGEYHFIPLSLAEQLAPSDNFRDLLAYEYDSLEPSKVYNLFQNALSQYPLYVKSIQLYLDSIENDSHEAETEDQN